MYDHPTFPAYSLEEMNITDVNKYVRGYNWYRLIMPTVIICIFAFDYYKRLKQIE